MERLDYLQHLDDDELFKLANHLDVEYEQRIIALLEKHGVTQFTFDCSDRDCPIMTVCDYDNGSKSITVVSVGYSIDMIGNDKLSNKNLYVIDDKDIIYSGEDIILNDTLWDVYHEMKEKIK